MGTFIAAYHYIRIFNSWVDAYEFPAVTEGAADSIAIQDPTLTGKPFNDAYRYMDWLLTVPLLLIEIIFCCNLSPDETVKKSWALGVSSGLMIAQVCYATVISWCSYPVVYLFPMLGFEGPHAVIAIQLGYCVSDIISKCGVGFLIYNITITKSAALNNSLLGK